MSNYFKKQRKLLDADTTLLEVFQHSLVNFIYGLLSGLAIASISTNNPYLIFISYYLLKQTESKILNRNKYTTKLGQKYIFPIPSTLGFLLGWKISNLISYGTV